MHSVLGAALDAARSALRRLEAAQVPNDLRKVAGYGGSLPPPLVKSLLKGLEQYEWLREKSIEQLPEGADGARADAAVLYLERPDGWELRLAEIAFAAGGAASEEINRSVAAKNRELDASLKAAQEKVKAVQRESRAAIGALERKGEALASRRKSEAADEARDERDSERALQAAERTAGRHRDERDAAIEEGRRVRQALHEERRLRRRAEADAAASAETGVWAEDPVALAGRLDQTALMAKPAARTGVAPSSAVPAQTLRLPKGVAPDAKTAIDWLLGIEGAATVIVDGYNVAYLLQGERSPGSARARMAPLLRHLQKMAKGALKVMVVYDSDIGPAETALVHGLVSVRYSEAGETADDEIVRLVGDLGGPVVVISNDRAVRDRSEALGAIPLWSNALVAWAGTR